MAEITQITSILNTLAPMAPSGFAIAFHLRLTSADFLFQTYPKEWTDTYSEKGFIMVDPIVRWGFTETGEVRWSALADLDDHGIFEQSQSYGMKYGVAIAVEIDGNKSFAGFSRSDREYTDAEIAELRAHVIEIHKLTASTTGMDDETRDALTQLSIKMTHATSQNA
ncbi:MAG: autoinducer binding domain-containing protein [Pseudomonadota bacterium]